MNGPHPQKAHADEIELMDITTDQSEFCTGNEFPLQTIHIHFYAPIAWTDDLENQRIHDALAVEIERFRAIAQDLVNGIVEEPQNSEMRIGVHHH